MQAATQGVAQAVTPTIAPTVTPTIAPTVTPTAMGGGQMATIPGMTGELAAGTPSMPQGALEAAKGQSGIKQMLLDRYGLGEGTPKTAKDWLQTGESIYGDIQSLQGGGRGTEAPEADVQAGGAPTFGPTGFGGGGDSLGFGGFGEGAGGVFGGFHDLMGGMEEDEEGYYDIPGYW
jgi:hypothetical protein